MGNSKLLEPEEIQVEAVEAIEDEEWKKTLAARQASEKAKDGYPKPTDSLPEAITKTPELTRPKSLSLGTSPELALGDLRASKSTRPLSIINVTPPPPLKSRRSSIAPHPGPSSSSRAAAGPAASLALPPGPSLPGTLPLRPGPRPPSKRARIFGSCFGGPLQSSSGYKLRAAQLQIPRGPRSRRGSSADSTKPVEPGATAKKGPDSDTNKSVSIVVTDNCNVSSRVAITVATPRSPSCTCPTDTAGNAGNKEGPSPEFDPSPISMNKTVPENDNSGISSGQQVLNAVLNAQLPDIIAVVQRADSSRQAEAGVSPIRGLRPNRRTRIPSWRLQELRYNAGGQPGRGPREHQRKGRQPLLRSTGYTDGSGGRFADYNGATPAPSTTSSGVARLFDSIIGRPSRDYAEQQTQHEEARPQSPPFPADYAWKQRKRNPQAKLGSSRAPGIRILNREQEEKEQRQHYSVEIPPATDSSRDQEYSEPTSPPRTSSRDQDAEFDQEAQVDQTDRRDQDAEYSGANYNSGDQTDRRDQDVEYSGANYNSGDQTKSREQDYSSSDQTKSREPDYSSSDQTKNREQDYSSSDQTKNREQDYSSSDQTKNREQDYSSSTSGSEFRKQKDYRWKKKDPYREAVEKKVKRDPLRRGYPDPSFNPRPGDIIVRARKRAGLRLTDFFYYDNENYMEQGDQILRAKFDYLPPLDTMYLWCRLYVYGADGGYTFLDSTSESVGKFKIGADTDFKTFKEPGRFI